MKAQENYIDYEVRLRMVENAIIAMKDEFKKLDAKIDSHFKWTLTVIFGSMITNIAMFGTIALHSVKLI